LKTGWQHVNAAGLGTGGALRKLCARVNCRQIALKSSLYCRHHDVHWRRKRLAQLVAARTLVCRRDDLARAPPEATFIEDCRRAGLSPSRTALVCLDTLRWAWRRSVLNYHDDPGWQRALAAACCCSELHLIGSAERRG
jgi:hypothetical protein